MDAPYCQIISEGYPKLPDDFVHPVFYHAAPYVNIQQRTFSTFIGSTPDLDVSLVRSYPEEDSYVLIFLTSSQIRKSGMAMFRNDVCDVQIHIPKTRLFLELTTTKLHTDRRNYYFASTTSSSFEHEVSLVSQGEPRL